MPQTTIKKRPSQTARRGAGLDDAASSACLFSYGGYDSRADWQIRRPGLAELLRLIHAVALCELVE